MKRIAIQIACAVFFFFLSFKLTIRTPAPSDKRVKTMNGGIDYAAKYAGIKTRREYFAAVFSDPRLQIDSGIVKMAKSRNKGKGINYQFLYTESSIQAGKRFIEDRGEVLEKVRQKYGVSPNFIAAILRLETNFGSFIGNHLAVNALYTVGLAYPKKSRDARRQLNSFIDLSRKYGWDPFSIKSSWAGAFGIPQFMPGSFAYAVDGNGDGVIDLFNMDDAVMSAGNFLKIHGWRNNDPLAEKNALRSYNRGSYADAIIKYAAMLKKNNKQTR
ncbi:MAG: lytic murein transglycosylase [Patescibacteria group bacterium]